MARQKFYAVRRGRKPGIYMNWEECEKMTTGFHGNQFKSFNSMAEAKLYMQSASTSSNLPASTSNVSKVSTKVKSNSKPERGIALENIYRQAVSYQQKDIDESEFMNSVSDAAECKLHSHNLKWSHFDKKELKTTTDGVQKIFTDGSSLGNGLSGARCGYGVYWGRDSDKNVAKPVLFGEQTNNHGELLGLLYAFRQINELDPKDAKQRFDVYTDSQYGCNCITKHARNWVRNGWKTAAKQPVKHKELIQEINKTINAILDKKIDIRLKYIPAHVGHEGNEEADKLAKLGARMSRPRD